VRGVRRSLNNCVVMNPGIDQNDPFFLALVVSYNSQRLPSISEY
jgi:hypothetical protein